jgi:hypothetical protein
MGTAATPSHLNNPFANYISQIDAISIEELIGEARFGAAYSFRDLKPVLEEIKEFAGQLRYIDTSGMAGRTVGKVSSCFQELFNNIQPIRSFNPANYGGGNYPNIIATYNQQVRNSYDNLFDAALPVLLYSNLRLSGMKNAEVRTSEILATLEKRISQQLAILTESEAMLASQKKFTQEVAVTGYGTLFARQALDHDAAARKWLGAAGFFAGIVVMFGGINYWNTVKALDEFSKLASSGTIQPNIPSSLTIQFALAKVVLFTIGLSAAYWSARVYRSHRHNSVVNQHRANALTSFQTFVSSTSDSEVKNAVLLQTTSCIYAPQPTGFTSSAEGDGESPLKVLEIVRNLQK